MSLRCIRVCLVCIVGLGQDVAAQEAMTRSAKTGELDVSHAYAEGPVHIPATMSLAQIRSAVERIHQRIKSLVIEVRSTNVPAKNNNWVRTVVAVKDQCRARLFEHVGREEDPRECFSFYDGRMFNVYYPYLRVYEVSQRFAKPPFIDKLRTDAFLEVLGWWPPDDPSPPPKVEERHFFVKKVLSEEACRVRPFQEVVEGRRCHIVEVPYLDALWIDAAAGIVVRRERRAGVPPRPCITYEMKDFREVAPGIVLPFVAKRVLHFEESRQTLHEVLRYEVNNVLDSQFTFCPGPGTLVSDRDTDTVQQIPGGLDFLGIIRERVRAKTGIRPVRHWYQLGDPIYLCLLGACGVGLYCIFRAVPWLYNRYRRWSEPSLGS